MFFKNKLKQYKNKKFNVECKSNEFFNIFKHNAQDYTIALLLIYRYTIILYALLADHDVHYSINQLLALQFLSYILVPWVGDKV